MASRPQPSYCDLLSSTNISDGLNRQKKSSSSSFALSLSKKKPAPLEPRRGDNNALSPSRRTAADSVIISSPGCSAGVGAVAAEVEADRFDACHGRRKGQPPKAEKEKLEAKLGVADLSEWKEAIKTAAFSFVLKLDQEAAVAAAK